jgi:hypothetical protein
MAAYTGRLARLPAAISALRAASSLEAILMSSRMIENRKIRKIPKRRNSAA